MQFVIEAASVAHGFSVVVPSPQSRRVCRTVGASHAGTFVTGLL